MRPNEQQISVCLLYRSVISIRGTWYKTSPRSYDTHPTRISRLDNTNRVFYQGVGQPNIFNKLGMYYPVSGSAHDNKQLYMFSVAAKRKYTQRYNKVQTWHYYEHLSLKYIQSIWSLKRSQRVYVRSVYTHRPTWSSRLPVTAQAAAQAAAYCLTTTSTKSNKAPLA
jgi:hypothetical protein